VSRAATLERGPLVRATAIGLATIVPISVVVEILDHNVDDFDSSAWMWPPVIALLAAYAMTGAVAARGARGAALTHGALAALGAFGGFLVVRVGVPVVQGDDLGFGVRNVVVNALLAIGFGMLGASFAERQPPV
jgi:hypothetical protein